MASQLPTTKLTPPSPILTPAGTLRECCANCRHFEDWREIPREKKHNEATGLCEYYGDEETHDPADVTCFEFEPKDEFEELP